MCEWQTCPQRSRDSEMAHSWTVGRAVPLWWCTFSNAVNTSRMSTSPPVLPRAAKSNPRKIIYCFLSNSLEFECEILLVNADRSGRAVDVDADEAWWTIHEGRVRCQQSWIQTYWTECQINESEYCQPNSQGIPLCYNCSIRTCHVAFLFTTCNL